MDTDTADTANPDGNRQKKMIDFHSHILPKMDDGSRSIEESLMMLRTSAKQGIHTIAATSHFYAEENTIEQFLQRRQAAWERLYGSLRPGMPEILLGAEVHYYEGMQRSKELPLLRIGKTNLLLLEMPFSPWSDRMVSEIIGLNRRPDMQILLAHIERYLRFQKASVWDSLLENGVFMQVNASFFLGSLSRYTALRMVKKGKIHLLGSDCHNMTSRPPQLGEAIDVLRSHNLLDEIDLRGQNMIHEKEVQAH